LNSTEKNERFLWQFLMYVIGVGLFIALLDGGVSGLAPIVGALAAFPLLFKFKKRLAAETEKRRPESPRTARGRRKRRA
jgi:membrane associated rhomboid family serine protease